VSVDGVKACLRGKGMGYLLRQTEQTLLEWGEDAREPVAGARCHVFYLLIKEMSNWPFDSMLAFAGGVMISQYIPHDDVRGGRRDRPRCTA